MSQEEMKKFAEPQDIAQDVHELSLQTRVAHADEREDGEKGREAEEEEEEEEEEEDFYEDDLMWFDGHQVKVGQVRRASNPWRRELAETSLRRSRRRWLGTGPTQPPVNMQ